MVSNIIGEETVDLLSNDEFDSILASLDIDILSKDVKIDKRVQCPFCERFLARLRHTRYKHPETLPTTAKKCTVEDVMPFALFKKCIHQVLKQLGDDQCYPDEIKNQIKGLEDPLALDQVVSLFISWWLKWF